MPDQDRQTVLKSVYQRLRDPDFGQRFIVGADGTRPIFVALPSDAMGTVLDALDHNGGAGNVVVPVLNGYMVVRMTSAQTDDHGDDDCSAENLTSDCTVGVFIHRLWIDGNDACYRFVRPDGSSAESGRAGVVALAG